MTERTGRISTVDGGEDVTTGEEKDSGDGVGNSGPLSSGVCSGSQSSAHSVGKKRQKVQPGVAMLDGRVSRDEKQDVKVVVDVKDRELIMCSEWVCE